MTKSVVFEPWVGKDYPSGGIFKQKVLVLGESHYCPEMNGVPPCRCENPAERPDCKNFTKDVIRDVVYHYSGEPYMRTFACFERAVFGQVPSQEEREAFWNSVSFYNYLQFAMSGPRLPIKRSTKESEEAFRQVLDCLMPDKVIIWGRKLYNIMPYWEGHDAGIIAKSGQHTDGWVYNINGKDIPCMMVHHPSSPSGKNWEYWHPLYDSFLNL